MLAQRCHLPLSLKEHVLMMFLIQDLHITFVAIAMKKIKIIICSRLVCAHEKKSLISLNNGMNKIHHNNWSWGRNYILYVLCPYTLQCRRMLIRKSREDMENSGCSIQYITVTVLNFTSITSKPWESDYLTAHLYPCQTLTKGYKTQNIKIKSELSR